MKKQRGQIVVDKILDTAEKLFYTQGYSNTGINQVIEEADIAKASLYKHFESKTDLMVAYLQRFHLGWYQRLEEAVEKVTDPQKKLLAIFDHNINRQQIREFGGCPFVKANDEAGTTDPKILAEIQLAKQRLKNFIAKLVAQSGHKKILTDKELTETIFLMVEGGVVAASVFKEADDLQAAKKIIQKLL
ncbi:TetR/AcrR family transcriptional regulator [Ferruginibacter sp.]